MHSFSSFDLVLRQLLALSSQMGRLFPLIRLRVLIMDVLAAAMTLYVLLRLVHCLVVDLR